MSFEMAMSVVLALSPAIVGALLGVRWSERRERRAHDVELVVELIRLHRRATRAWLQIVVEPDDAERRDPSLDALRLPGETTGRLAHRLNHEFHEAAVEADLRLVLRPRLRQAVREWLDAYRERRIEVGMTRAVPPQTPEQREARSLTLLAAAKVHGDACRNVARELTMLRDGRSAKALDDESIHWLFGQP